MSSDCIVKVTGNGNKEVLYLEHKGYLAHGGAKIAIAARALAEHKDFNVSDYLMVGSGLDFGPVGSTDGLNLTDMPHYYHISLKESGNVMVSYRKDGKTLKRLKLASFIRKVNKARSRANYPYKMLRQARSNNEPVNEPRPYTLIEREQIAQIIIDQMGGLGPLRAMLGASNFMALDTPAGLKFDFKGCPGKSNKCQVVYNPGSDTYNLEFYYFTRIHFSHCPKVKSYDNIYFDMLKELFTEYTGLYCTL